MCEFEYPDVLSVRTDMYKKAVCISRDSAIFSDRKPLMDKHFAEYPIYVDESYYTHCELFPRLVRNGDDYKEGAYRKMSDWRDCHYYRLMEYEGHRYYILTGGKYD